MRRHARLVSAAATAGAVLVATVLAAQTRAGGDDLRGTVRSPAGPEAGVWVIAETDGLDTGFRKIVVTDDEGRFLVPDLPDASFRVWVRGYGLVDSDPVMAEPGQTLALDAAPAGSPQEAAQVYPANYWYSLLEPPAAGEFPRHRAGRKRHRARSAQPGRVGRRHQAGLPALSPDGQPVHVRHQPPRRVRLVGRGLGPPADVRPARPPDERGPRPVRARAGARDVRRLERPHRRRRGARGAAAAAGGRAQPRVDDVGLGRRDLLRARRGDHGQARPHRQRRRARLRRVHHHRQARHHRHRAAPLDRARRAAARAARDGAVDVPDRARLRALAVLGRRDHLRRPPPTPTTR